MIQVFHVDEECRRQAEIFQLKTKKKKKKQKQRKEKKEEEERNSHFHCYILNTAWKIHSKKYKPGIGTANIFIFIFVIFCLCLFCCLFVIFLLRLHFRFLENGFKCKFVLNI